MVTLYSNGSKSNPTTVFDISEGLDVAVERDRPIFVRVNSAVYKCFPSRRYEVAEDDAEPLVSHASGDYFSTPDSTAASITGDIELRPLFDEADEISAEAWSKLRISHPTQMMRFTHDCDKCIPLGQQGLYDLYYHPSNQIFIARYGNEGPDYKSGIALVGIDPELTKAYDLAVEQNLTKPSRG